MSKGIIILCAGGTGGHLFPAEALAHELTTRGWEVHLATDARAQRFAAKFPAKAVHVIRSATISGRNPVALAKTLWRLWQGNLDARRLFRRLKPKLVAGFGGYPTLPPLYAATRMRIPTFIHEQNAVMGRANKGLAARVDAIAGGFLKARGPYAEKIVETGNPVRQAVLDVADTPYEVPAGAGLLRLLVFGGSQGARFSSDVVPEAIACLPEALRSRLHITQQARPEDEERVRDRYAGLGVEAEVAPFFSDLPARMAASHLVIARSGASTVLELSVIGRPAILVPLPHALDDDQGHNAQLLVNVGGAFLRRQPEITAESLAGDIAVLFKNDGQLAAMAKAAQSAGRPDATRLLADLAEAIASGKPISELKKGERP
ncbi:undecaprenyldiphospho-muramoylpentapeptide beta-N-acetylglucosaminyltransferase [Phyllobacterium phragmitis]|uniref:UDP-N-acetylglucosamine--N-acetylmuramyl-(pentapeptide) pyrophosphoryl-undecaprenol N-acetylglucosamine transferase n=1 Tax=Phyllobacterium phragmitis TaxID=2670329 RepID=A0A2S9IXD8_9HYPH|nr:undecaprenyldiphospho-muramoylpentapeptide beta-N-acetylglucosaminyltransferase [Phyllobacterium phragmitis]PRD45193.1 undecaprenyldiphospho-muramoylpentapeptide beta-N-acetylglucosaminyltransferase [Phyllobacterium phragmitis]